MRLKEKKRQGRRFRDEAAEQGAKVAALRRVLEDADAACKGDAQEAALGRSHLSNKNDIFIHFFPNIFNSILNEKNAKFLF